MNGILNPMPPGILSDPRQAAMLQAGLSLLQSSGPSKMPVGLGQAIGQAGMQGLNAFQQIQQAQLQEEMRKRQIAMQEEQLKLQRDRANRPPAPLVAGPGSQLFRPGETAPYAVVPFKPEPAREPKAPMTRTLQIDQDKVTQEFRDGKWHEVARGPAFAKTVVPPPGAQPPAKPTTGQSAVDKEFAKEYVAFRAAGGYADIEKQLGQLQEASAALASDPSLTGPIRGALPDAVRAVTNPQAVATKEKVQEVAQRNLRLVLGAQFTEKEGERLIARVYNDRLPPEENKRRVDRLITQITDAAKAKQSAADFFEKNGTLTGWDGKLYTISDFEPEPVSTDLKQPKPAASPKNYTEADLKHTAMKHGISVQEVKRRLGIKD
jgi:hypothetical protein